MEKRRCYVSRCYPHNLAGGYKAKTDIELIMKENNFHNLGLQQKFNDNKIYGFFYNLISVFKAIVSVKKDDILVIQYPLKKYYFILSYMAQLKGAKVVALIHDLGCFRRKKLTVEQEKKRLEYTNHLIVLSDKMKEFVIKEKYKQSLSVLHLWDYLNDTIPQPSRYPQPNHIDILYVGTLKENQHGFIYKWDNTTLTSSLNFDIYGSYFNFENIKYKKQFKYHGLKDSSLIIQDTKAHYGLLWYGVDTDSISGAYGEYLKYNTSHKISLYIHAHIPLIVWSKASFADFTRKYNIGICVDTLDTLEQQLQTISEDEYNQMVENTKYLSEKIQKGYYFMTAYKQAEKLLLSDSNIGK